MRARREVREGDERRGVRGRSALVFLPYLVLLCRVLPFCLVNQYLNPYNKKWKPSIKAVQAISEEQYMCVWRDIYYFRSIKGK